MARALPLLFAAFLVVAAAPVSVGTAADAAATRPDRATNTTSVMLVPSPDRSGFAGSRTDLGAAVSVGGDELAGRLSVYTLEARFEDAPTAERKAAVLDGTLSRVDARVDDLAAAERRAREAYRNGSISSAAYVRRLAGIDSRAGELATLVRRVGSLAVTVDAVDGRFSNRTRFLRLRLAFHQGPVRDRAAAALSGREPPLRAYVSASADGLLLTAVFNGSYVQETTRLDHYDGATVGASVDLDEAFNRSAELYPAAWNQSSGARVDSLGADAFRVTVPYGSSVVEAYVDGTTGQVFREIQRKSVDTLPLGPTVSERRSELVLTAYRTHAGGPLRVTLADDGDPVQGTIRVEGTPVGTTTNGTLWTVGAGTEFVVSAERGETQIPLIVRPVEQDEVGNATA